MALLVCNNTFIQIIVTGLKISDNQLQEKTARNIITKLIFVC